MIIVCSRGTPPIEPTNPGSIMQVIVLLLDKDQHSRPCGGFRVWGVCRQAGPNALSSAAGWRMQVIVMLLDKDQDSRPTAAQVLEHPALKAVSDAVRQPEAELDAGLPLYSIRV